MINRMSVLLIAWLCLPIGAAWGAGPESAARHPAWEVEVTYHRPGDAEDNPVTARWRFEVRGEIGRSGAAWWRVNVKDADGRSPVEAEFLLDPAGGRIAEIQVWEFFQGAWHEYPLQQTEPAVVYFHSFGPLPLDYIGRSSLAPDRVQHFKHTERRPLDEGLFIRRDFTFRAEPVVPPSGEFDALPASGKATAPFLAIQASDSLMPGSVRIMTWDRTLPWWVEYRTPAYSARLVRWEEGAAHE
jgi:hypothetical protein